MDRNIVYPGAIPLDTDVLRAAQNTMVAFGAIAAAMLGSAVVVDGLACAPAGGLTVQIGPGSIFQALPLEATPYGSLPADTSDSVVKCGINTQPVTTATLSAPGGVGQAINYLIEAQLLEADTGSVVLPYYNAANPAVAFSGPSNSGGAQNTLRTQRVSLQVKAGAAAATGSQATPGADAGWVPLWIVTVNNGAVSLAGGNIAQHPQAPFIPAKLGPGMWPGFSRTLVIPSSQVFVAPLGVTRVKARVWGGGGGGGGTANASSVGSGGGGGGYAEGVYAVTPGASYAVTVGGFGSGGNSSGSSGAAGGSSSFGGLVSATGGGGGTGNAIGTISGPGGGSGNGSGGQLNVAGVGGGTGFITGGGGFFSGAGGAAFAAAGGPGSASSASAPQNGSAGIVPGSGGSAGIAGGVGGSGAYGLVILEY